MPSVTLSWAYARAVLAVASDWAFGSTLGYLALTLFWSGHLGRDETWALGGAAAIYTLSRVALLAEVINGRRAAAAPLSCGRSLPPEPALSNPGAAASEPSAPSDPGPDTTKSSEAGRP